MDNVVDLQPLFRSQKLAVLATCGRNKPYSNLVAFAASTDSTDLFFATKRDTRKYQNLIENPAAALLIDNRTNQESDFRDSVAVTAEGFASELVGGKYQQGRDVYLARHPHLGGFVNDPDVALFKIDVDRYIIARFDSTSTLTVS